MCDVKILSAWVISPGYGLELSKHVSKTSSNQFPCRSGLMRGRERGIQFLRNSQLVRGLVELSRRLQCDSQIIVSSGVFRVPCDYRLQLANRGWPIAGVGGQPGERAVSVRQAWSQFSRFAKFGGSLRFVAPSHQQPQL